MPDTPEFGGDYLVGWKLRVILRLEEYGNTAPIKASAPTVPPQTMRGVKPARSTGTYQKQAAQGSNPGGYVVSFAGGTVPPAGGPQGASGSPDGLTFVIGAVIPKSFKWGVNGFKEPDTMDCELKFVDVPFDPMCFRSVAVELYVGTMTQDDYTAGISGGTRQSSLGASQPDEPLNVVPDGYTGPNGEQRSNLRFQGFVDEWEVVDSDEQISLVNFKCTDNTRLLMDQPMPPGHGVSTVLPMDEAIAQFLSAYPQFAGLTVQYQPSVFPQPAPVFGKAFADVAQLKDRVTPSQGGAGQTLSVWDYLVEVCTCMGHNIRVEGTTVVVQRIRSALGKNFPSRYNDPFQGRTWGGASHLLRTFIMGRNCKMNRRKRKYSRTGVNVECRSYSPLHKATLIARFPPFLNSGGGGSGGAQNSTTNRLVHTLPGGGREETKYTVFPVPGVSDQATLNNIAQAYYEGLNRSELNVGIHTRDLSSYGGSNEDPDVLDMLAGDRFEFLKERFDGSTDGYPSTDLSEIEDAFLQANPGDLFSGFDQDFITQYMTVYRAKGFQTTFVLRRMDVTGTIEDEGGIDIHLDGANCVEARVDAPGVADGSDAALGAQGNAAPSQQGQPGGP